VVAVLSFFLLTLFPFYPLYVSLVLALVLGALAFEFAGLSMLLATLLSVFAGFYQDPYLGLVYFIVFILFASVGMSWIELALIASSWVLAFIFAPLAVVPVIIAGLHLDRIGAVKIGVVSAVGIFLLAWASGLSNAGLMLVPFPAQAYTPKPIPANWQFGDFIPSMDVFTSPAAGTYFSSLASNLSDVRVYALIAAWAISGYLAAILSTKWKKLFRLPPSIIGAVPALAVAFVFAGAAILDVVIGFIGVAVAAVAYSAAYSVLAAPALGAFRGFQDIVPGGIPQKYSLLLGSPVCEERNLVIEQFFEDGVKRKSPCFLLTSDLDFAKNAHARYGDKLTVLVANARADSMAEKNVLPISTGIQNLTALNIELVKAVRSVASTGGKVCLDVMSDILLTHKMLTTRKWVSDLVPRLDEWGFGVLGTFNPVLHAGEEAKGLPDLFKGYLEIFDKDFAGKMRKVIVARKMTDLQFKDSELILDKQALRKKEAKGLSGRLR
jgi:KaiC/GvpD/RAD55 family RecA-like ATPase